MAWSADVASLGTAQAAATGTSISFTTSGTTDPNSVTVISATVDGTTISSVTVGGVNATKIGEGANGLDAGAWWWIGSIASGTTIQANFAASGTNRALVAGSLKCANSTPTHGTDAAATTSAGSTGWNTNSLTAGANDVIFGIATSWSSSATDTPTAPTVELTEYVPGSSPNSDKSLALVYRTGAGANQLVGTWAASVQWVAVAGIFTEPAGGATLPVRIANPRVGPMALRHQAARRPRPRVFTGGGATDDLAATTAGVATVTAALSVTRALQAAVTGVATVTGQLKATRPLSATAAGTSVVTAALKTTRPIQALAAGVATVTAALKATRSLAATPTGTATVAAQIAEARPLAAAAAGSSVVTGLVTNVGAPVTAKPGYDQTPEILLQRLPH